jgi:AcrR family transcriptional regulator
MFPNSKKEQIMEQKLDLRIQKTHLALTNTFMELLKEKPFEAITVGELCERAMVRRATFYKHFADKYEFFTFMIRGIQKKFNAETAQKADLTKPQDYYVCIVQNTLDFLSQNESLVNSVLKSSMLPQLLDILSEEIAYDVGQKLKGDKKRGIELPANPEFMAQIFTGALISSSPCYRSSMVSMTLSGVMSFSRS